MIGSFKRKWNNLPLTVKVSTSYAVCSIIQKCLALITLPFFTRLLTKEQYGQYTIYTSWSSILMIFLTLNLAYGSFQTAMVKYEDKRAEYISSVQSICLMLSAVFLVVYLPLRSLWNKYFELPTLFVLLMVGEIIFNTSIQLWMGRERFEFKYKSIVAVTLLISFISPVIAFVLMSLTEEKGYARILGYVGVNIIAGLIVFIMNEHRGKTFYNKEFWKYALGFNVPLLAYYLSQVIFNQSDRIMISHMTGTSDAAMYGVAYSLAMILNFVLSSINGSYVPWLFGKIKANKGEENKSISLLLVALIGLLILGIIWYAPEIIYVMAGSNYAEATGVVAPVAMSLLLLFYCQLFINVEFYYEEKKMLVYGSVGAAVLNIVLNYLLIPIYGFVVAGYTTFLSYIVFAISNCITMKHCLKKRDLPDNMYNYKALLGVFVFFVVVGFLGVALYELILVRICITLVVSVIVFIKRQILIDALKRIRER